MGLGSKNVHINTYIRRRYVSRNRFSWDCTQPNNLKTGSVEVVTHMISAGTHELLLELFEEKIDLETFKNLSSLPTEELNAIIELITETGC